MLHQTHERKRRNAIVYNQDRDCYTEEYGLLPHILAFTPSVPPSFTSKFVQRQNNPSPKHFCR